MRIRLKKPAVIITLFLVSVAFFKVHSYYNKDLPGRPPLQRIHVDSGVIDARLNNSTLKVEFWSHLLDESVVRFENAPKCNNTLVMPSNLDQLSAPTSDPEIWEWIQNRIRLLWDQWKQARLKLNERGALDGFKRKRVLILPGMLTGTRFARRSSIEKGGPLGELIQWSDLIGGLYVLGHDVTLEHDVRLASIRLRDVISQPPSCDRDYDVIYLDRASVNALPPDIQKAYRCRIRVLDVYGTQAMYSDAIYKETHRLHGYPDAEFLQTKQYQTFYPQTPDNTFLGFVVTRSPDSRKTKKENIAVLYGKSVQYTRGKESYIALLSKYVDVHYTMPHNIQISTPRKLYNNGVLSGARYASLLDKAKIVIGLGHPIEGTGAMEALAHGCVFFNPKYVGAAQNIFKDGSKPTHRLITSQIPYLEQYIGPPFVYTVDTNNKMEIVDSLKKSLNKTNYEPFIPEEFTIRGYLERLSVLVERQNFCDRYQNVTWPPLSALSVIVSDPDQSCSTACSTKGMICEPVYFYHLNEEASLKRQNILCSKISFNADIIRPSLSLGPNTDECVLQENGRLFSCEGASAVVRRICPCRPYRKHQVALPA